MTETQYTQQAEAIPSGDNTPDTGAPPVETMLINPESSLKGRHQPVQLVFAPLCRYVIGKNQLFQWPIRIEQRTLGKQFLFNGADLLQLICRRRTSKIQHQRCGDGITVALFYPVAVIIRIVIAGKSLDSGIQTTDLLHNFGHFYMAIIYVVVFPHDRSLLLKGRQHTKQTQQ
jgi:hypothetical protein